MSKKEKKVIRDSCVVNREDQNHKPPATNHELCSRDAAGVTWSSKPPGYSKKGVKQNVKVS